MFCSMLIEMVWFKIWLKVVSCYRDPQHQVCKNYTYGNLPNLGLMLILSGKRDSKSRLTQSIKNDIKYMGGKIERLILHVVTDISLNNTLIGKYNTEACCTIQVCNHSSQADPSSKLSVYCAFPVLFNMVVRYLHFDQSILKMEIKETKPSVGACRKQPFISKSCIRPS